MKRVLVCGAGGFIGHHLVKRLKAEGHYVLGVDRRFPEYETSPADEFLTMDLRSVNANDFVFDKVDECYQLACEVGGLGYIMDRANDAAMLRNSVQININVLEACRFHKIPKVFYASSACVYPSTASHAEACREDSVPPANPDNEYAWEKVFGERLYDAYARNFGIEIRIARFHNCYGPLGTWKGGREKFPAAICRKVAEAPELGDVEIWGDGLQTRSFMYVDDAVEGMLRLMASDCRRVVNIGSSRLISVNSLADMVVHYSGKRVHFKHIDGPVGVRGRNSDNTRIRRELGWEPSYSLIRGIRQTYNWIASQLALDRVKREEVV